MKIEPGYFPADLTTLAAAVGLIVSSLVAGLVITRLQPRWSSRLLAWGLTIGGTVGMEWLCRGEPAGVRMLLLIGELLYGMKMIVLVESRKAGEPPLTLVQWLAFVLLWPGMRPGIFRNLGGPVLRDAAATLIRGVLRLLLGAALIALAVCIWHLWRSGVSELVARIAATLLLLAGISLVMHFGVFNIVVGLWRFAGVDARPLFRSPLAARTLGDFWGRRWNLAFSEMTAIGVYRPLADWKGRSVGMVGAFVCSGLLHEVAISVPVLWGFGLPSAYFGLHGLLVLLESRLDALGIGPAKWGWLSHGWVLLCVALPAPILFHQPFLRGCVWPLIGME